MNKTKKGALLVSSVIIALVVILLCNVLFGILADRFSFMQFDMSPSGIYSLSDESKAVVDSLSAPVSIYYATNAANRKADFLEILSMFDKASDKITVTEVNIDLDTAFRQTYRIEGYNTVVVECEQTAKKRVLSPNLTVRSVTNNAGIASDDFTYLESYVASAVAFTQNPDPVSVSIAYGHAEATENSEYLDFLMGLLYREAMSVQAFDFATDPIPAGTDIVLFVGPTMDFTRDDIKKLDDYMESGGRAQIYASPGYDLPELYTYLEQNWAVKVESDRAVETNDSYVLTSGAGRYLLPILGDHDITHYIMQTGARVRIPEGTASSLTVSDASESIETTVLLTTTQEGKAYTGEGYAALAAHEPAEPVYEGGMALLAYVRKNPLNNQETTTRMLVSGSYQLIFDTMVDPSSSYANKDLFVKSVNFMSGAEDAPVSVASKPRVFEKMDPLSGTRLSGYLIFLIGVVPAVLLCAAIVIFIRRRRL